MVSRTQGQGMGCGAHPKDFMFSFFNYSLITDYEATTVDGSNGLRYGAIIGIVSRTQE